MKKTVTSLFAAVVLVLPVVAQGGQGAAQIVTINTANVPGYLA